MNRGDFLVCQESKQFFLMQVSELANGTIYGFLVKDAHVPGKKTNVEVMPKDVVTNLGPKPNPGTVYGLDVVHHIGTKHHREFGRISFLYRIDKEVGASVMQAFDKCSKRLKALRLDFVLGDGIWEIHPKRGNNAGMYKRSKKPDLNPHRFLIRPEGLPPTEFDYVIYHELAHHLHAEFVTSPKLNAAWINEFNTSIKQDKITKDQSVRLLEDLLAGEAPPSAFSSTLSEEDTKAYRALIRLISKDHNLSVRDLDTLFEADSREAIRDVWPARTIPVKELVPIVSEYATKNVGELIAESFAFHLVGKKLPKSVLSLLEKSISYAARQNDKARN